MIVKNIITNAKLPILSEGIKIDETINKAKDKANIDVNKSLASVFENLRRVSKDLKKAIQTEKRNINTLQEAIDDFDNNINRYVSQLKQQRYGRI